MFGVQAGVSDEPARAEQLRLQEAKLTGQIAVVPAVFLGEPLGVERPAFNEGRIEVKDTELSITR
jgi:hypothetical protein